MTLELKHGKKQYIVAVEFGDRKRLSLTVHPDLNITAKAPLGSQIEIINRRLQKRTPWIAKQIEYFEQFHPLPTPRNYISGETHYYLGRQYRLKVKQGIKPIVRLVGRYFEVEVQQASDTQAVQKVMQNWYLSHAKKAFERRLEVYLPILPAIGVTGPKVICRKMKTRWGSCSAKGKGTITLNTELVKAPVYCIDYVIVHELCHLRYPKHNHNFYRLLAHMLPDWEKRKQRLEKAIL